VLISALVGAGALSTEVTHVSAASHGRKTSISVARWPYGTPVTNMQMVLVWRHSAWGHPGSYRDLKTDARGRFPTPDYSLCDYQCELWIGTPLTQRNINFFNYMTGDLENQCLLPLSGSKNPQVLNDIQMKVSSPTVLWVANTDCVDVDFLGAAFNWHQSFLESQYYPRFFKTSDMEAFTMGRGVFDESVPLGLPM
jgi:hypothetical protein